MGCSEAWIKSGQNDKASSVEELRTANKGPSDSSLVSGSMEKKIGNLEGK